MRADTTTAPSGQSPFYRRSGFWKTAIPVLAAVAAFLIGMAVVNGLHTSGADRIPLPKGPPVAKTVKLTPQGAKDAHALIRQFVHTALAGKNTAASYALLGPTLRQPITLKQWKSGQTTVVPYPVDAKTTLIFEKPDYVHANDMKIEVHVITPDKPNLTKLTPTERFYATLIKRDGRWLVDNWVPRWTSPLLNSSG